MQCTDTAKSIEIRNIKKNFNTIIKEKEMTFFSPASPRGCMGVFSSLKQKEIML